MNEESIHALVRLGYTREEAQFVYIVAIHSGCFTHRQFLNYSETKPGKHSQKFLERLLTAEHATFHAYQCGGRVYHIFSRKVFKAIGCDNLRTRRRHQLEYVKTRLVALDFVLSRADRWYLETEQEKVRFFEDQLGIGRDLLPSKVYGSATSSAKTTRYFVDRFPMFVQHVPSSARPIVFTYIDPVSATLAGLETHLQAYARFFRALPQFEFVYVSPSDRFFQTAHSEFFRIVFGGPSRSSRSQLIRYFRLRRAWEANERVAALDVLFLNAAKARFRDQEFDSLYNNWARGTLSEAEIASSLTSGPLDVRGMFSTCKCGESLSVFTHPGEALDLGTSDTGSEPFSSQLSPRLSPL